MFNPLSFLSKFVKSNNQRELDRIGKIVEKINSLDNQVQNLEDTDFPKKTLELKNKLKNGNKIEDLLPEAFALVREASKRIRKESTRRSKQKTNTEAATTASTATTK